MIKDQVAPEPKPLLRTVFKQITEKHHVFGKQAHTAKVVSASDADGIMVCNLYDGMGRTMQSGVTFVYGAQPFDDLTDDERVRLGLTGDIAKVEKAPEPDATWQYKEVAEWMKLRGIKPRTGTKHDLLRRVAEWREGITADESQSSTLQSADGDATGSDDDTGTKVQSDDAKADGDGGGKDDIIDDGFTGEGQDGFPEPSDDDQEGE